MASVEEAIQVLSRRVREHTETISTEEAAKTSIILPFLQALGYDVFNPGEVVPEFTADAVGKKGEKVDYAIRIDGEVKILIECKGLNTELEVKHLSQLFRYFTVTKAKFGLLTNGRIFKFYSDLEEPNKLDAKPFFVFDILNVNQAALAELKKFEKSSFDVEGILANAERLKYVSAVKNFLLEQLEAPSPDFVKVVASEVYDGRVTAHVREMIGSAIRSAFREIVRDAVETRLTDALKGDHQKEVEDETGEVRSEGEIETTEEEIEGMLIIRGIVRNKISGDRVGIRDAKSYCAVLIDDNNRRPLARLHFNRSQKYIGLFDGGSEERVPIDGLGDIYKYEDRLRATAEKYAD